MSVCPVIMKLVIHICQGRTILAMVSLGYCVHSHVARGGQTMTVRRNHGIAKGIHCTEIPFSSSSKALNFFFKFKMFRAVAYFRA